MGRPYTAKLILQSSLSLQANFKPSSSNFQAKVCPRSSKLGCSRRKDKVSPLLLDLSFRQRFFGGVMLYAKANPNPNSWDHTELFTSPVCGWPCYPTPSRTFFNVFAEWDEAHKLGMGKWKGRDRIGSRVLIEFILLSSFKFSTQRVAGHTDWTYRIVVGFSASQMYSCLYACIYVQMWPCVCICMYVRFFLHACMYIIDSGLLLH